MVESNDPAILPMDEIERQLQEAARIRASAKLPKTTGQKRKGEAKTKARINQALLRPGAGEPARDFRWTILFRPDYVKAVKDLAERLSEPRAKVSIAGLMEEAVELLLAEYVRREREAQGAEDGGEQR